jgi:hypothetical protein
MELKKSLSSFSDRDLLELILLNQVQFDRRLERMELHIQKSYEKVSEYNNAPYNLDGRQDGYSYSKTFEELVTKSSSAKSLINQLLKDENCEISW